MTKDEMIARTQKAINDLSGFGYTREQIGEFVGETKYKIGNIIAGRGATNAALLEKLETEIQRTKSQLAAKSPEQQEREEEKLLDIIAKQADALKESQLRIKESNELFKKLLEKM